MQSKYMETDGFSRGLAETDVNKGMIINNFWLGKNLILLPLCVWTIVSKRAEKKKKLEFWM